MSLPNGGDDDEQWRGHHQPPFGGKRDPSGFQKDHHGNRIILSSPSSEDNATAAETSVGSTNSVVSGLSSVAPGDHGGATPTAAPPQTPIPSTNSTQPQLQAQQLATQQPSPASPSANSATTSMRMIRTQRDMYLRQLRSLGIASGASFAVAVLVLVPPPVLLTMLLCCMVVLAFFYKLYQLLLWEYQRLVRGRGIGDYLPSSFYEQLTETTVHDFMSDTRNSYVNENAYLMLYMIPGLTPDQVNEYVGRLAPRHQELLHRQGLGNVLGNSFMRFVMGDERLQSQQRATAAMVNDEDNMAVISGVTESPSSSLASGGSAGGGGAGHHNIVPRRLELPPTIPEGAGEDDESATSDLGHDEDPTTQYLRFMGVEPDNADVTPTAAVRRRSSSAAVTPQTVTALTSDAPTVRRGSLTPSEAALAEAEAEEQVLYDAIGSAVTTYMGVAASMVQTSARRSATLFSGTLFRASMGMTIFGVGVGMYGFWTGVYNPQTFFQPVLQMLQSQVGTIMRPPRRLEMPQSQTLVSTTLFSGATAGVMLLFQLASIREEEKSSNQGCGDPDAKKNKEDGTPKKKHV